jgi:hypothetical protein
MGSNLGSTHMGSHLGGTHMGGGVGREFHRHHRYGGYFPPYGYAYGLGSLDCSLYDWQHRRQWPYTCY